MIPKVNGRGHSFNGVMAYLMHDKEAETVERVKWHKVGNMHTQDPVKAAQVMAWTDSNAHTIKESVEGSKAGAAVTAGGVYHYSLSWAHGETPDQEHQHAQVLATLERLGLSEHQYVAVAHDDTDHAHVHVVANLTNPETGKRHTPSLDKRELQGWALGYEKEHGIYCDQREINAQAREAGEPTKYRDQKQDYSIAITRAYYAADNGQAFVSALQFEGLQLAAARRGNGFLVIDEKGDIQKLARQLDIEERGKAKTAAINALLGDIDRDSLPDADRLSAEIKEQGRTMDVSDDVEEVEIAASEAEEKTVAEAVAEQSDESAWELLQEDLDLLPDEPPIEPLEELPNEWPESTLEGEPAQGENRGFQEQLLAAKQWVQDKVIAAYEYVKQRLTQQQEQTQEHER